MGGDKKRRTRGPNLNISLEGGHPGVQDAGGQECVTSCQRGPHGSSAKVTDVYIEIHEDINE
jgi:hypothetical protein